MKLLQKMLRVPGMFYCWGKSMGWRAALSWFAVRLAVNCGFKKHGAVELKPSCTLHPVIARLGGSSDMDAFYQVIVCEEYDCLKDISCPRFILDLGANVGYSSAYFLTCFPTSRILAVEPDPENFQICRANLAKYGDRAEVLLGAV